MANLTIDRATVDDEISGNEKIPVSDNGQPKSVDINLIKSFIVQALLNATATTTTENASLIVRDKDGLLRKITLETVLASAFAYLFGADAGAISSTCVLTFKDGSNCKTITYADFVTALSTSIGSTLNIGNLTGVESLLAADLAIVERSVNGTGANRKVSLGTLQSFVLAGLAAFLATKSADTPGSDDCFYFTHTESGTTTLSKIVFSDLAANFGNVTGPESTTEHSVPQWDSTTRKLKNGLAIAATVAATGSASASKLPTEAAVRAAIDAEAEAREQAIDDLPYCKKPNNFVGTNIPTFGTGNTLGGGYVVDSTIPASPNNQSIPTSLAVKTAISNAISTLSASISTSTILRAPNGFVVGNIPTFSSASSLGLGYGVRTSIRDANNASDTNIPTEKAVRDAIEDELGDFIVGPASVTQGYIPLWDDAQTLAAGVALRSAIRAAGTADDNSVVTEAAVRTALDAKAAATHAHSNATSSAAGFMSAADKSALDAVAGAATADAASTLSDSDSIAVRAGGTTWKKALLSTLWTYISSKLSVATTALAGLLPALSGNSSQFLKGDGTWGVPSGSEEFEGTDGETAGSAGLVPAPTTSDTNKFLNSNGNWESIEAAAAEDVAPEVLAIVRYDALFVPAAAMVPSASNGATASAVAFTNTKRDTLAFGTSADNAAEFDVALPDDWNNGSLKAKFYWTCNDSGASANTNVKWLIGCVGTQDGGSVSTAPSNYEDVTDALSQVNNVQTTPATDAFAPDGNSGPGNLLHFVVKRDNSNAPASPLAKDALLLGVAIQFARTSTLAPWSNS